MTLRPARIVSLAGALLLGGLAQTGQAQAGLGRGAESVEGDRAALQAARTSSAGALYTAHVLALPNGGVVKEFARADGMVFAVSWRAPGRPDLRQLLADSYETMQAAAPMRAGRPVRRPISVNTSSLLLVSGGHPGAFSGLAVLPRLQPAGLDLHDLK